MIRLDPFGVGAAQFMALDLFENASRASGRTTMTLGLIQKGDAIVVPSSEYKRLYDYALRDAGFKTGVSYHPEQVSVRVIPPRSDHRHLNGTNPFGRTHLTHEYTLEVYREALREAASRLLSVEVALSSSRPRPSPTDEPCYVAGRRMNLTAEAFHPL